MMMEGLRPSVLKVPVALFNFESVLEGEYIWFGFKGCRALLTDLYKLQGALKNHNFELDF